MPTEVSTAENVSNLTWLFFAAASVLLWRCQVMPQLGSRSRRSLCALLGLLLLLFPIISISDDLHPDLVVAVEGDSRSRQWKSLDAARLFPAPLLHSALWAGVKPITAIRPDRVQVASVVQFVPRIESRPVPHTTASRAPPQSPLC